VLLERSNKSVRLTPIGEQIVVRARRTLDEAAQLRRIAKAATDPFAGELRLGIFPTLAPYLLPSLMPRLTEHFPKLDILLIEEKTPNLIGMLERGELECALLAMPVHHPQFDSAALFEEPFTLAVANDHPLANRKRISLDDIRREPILLLEDGHCLRDQALAVCQMVGIAETRNFRATSLETLRHMVASGNAVTFVPKLATRDTDSGLVYIPFVAPAPMRQIGLYWRRTSASVKVFNAMADLIHREYRQL
jgi:LysR family hydrogen peroxide-inducible transcriptional activator